MALIELGVTNLAVIEAVRLSLGRGLVVVTGETGAGKSLVVDALALALGGRGTSDLVRSGSNALRVEAIFDDVPRDPQDPLDELVDLGDGSLIVSREVTAVVRSVGDAVRTLQRDGGALDGLRSALAQLEAAAAHDERFAGLAARAAAAVADATELARDAATLGEQVQIDTAARAGMEERLGVIYDLKRKYGESIEAIAAFGREATAELSRLEHMDTLREELRIEEQRLRAGLQAA